MKQSPTADYPVRVRPESWEHDPTQAGLYAGVYTVTLNATVDITFVPDLSRSAPPWDGRILPADLDALHTPEQAAYASALLARYVVTPNAARAGRVESFRPAGGALDGGYDEDSVVRYVEPAQYADFVGDLDRLAVVVGSVRSDTPVSALRDHPVIRFVEDDIVAAPWFGRDDVVWLGRPAPDRTG
jgi:hypothetical protein